MHPSKDVSRRQHSNPTVRHQITKNTTVWGLPTRASIKGAEKCPLPPVHRAEWPAAHLRRWAELELITHHPELSLWRGRVWTRSGIKSLARGKKIWGSEATVSPPSLSVWVLENGISCDRLGWRRWQHWRSQTWMPIEEGIGEYLPYSDISKGCAVRFAICL